MASIDINTTLPGEMIVSKVLDFIIRVRESMNDENRNKWDAIGLAMFQHWNNWWVEKGWPGEKID